MKTELNERVQGLIDELVESGEEVGLQVAAYVDDELVVDSWAGVADEAIGRLVDGNTLFTTWSTTKGFVATCLHILADRGLVDYDAPIATYWPEFSTHGKDAITVRHALTHTAGIPHLPKGVTPEMMTDWEAMCAAIADYHPLWPPGRKTGYHAWTFGWVIGEIVRRIDGRPFAQFAQEELCQPLGIEDFYLGISDAQESRVAPLMQDQLHAEAATKFNDLTMQVMMPFAFDQAQLVNRPDVRRACIPGGGGIMSARAIARHYAMLASYGVFAGTRILSAERIDVIRALQTDARDEVIGIPLRRGLGYGLGYDAATKVGNIAMGKRGREFGHVGNGGSLGFADPERKLAFGLTKNLMKAAPDPQKETSYLVAEEIRMHLDRAD